MRPHRLDVIDFEPATGTALDALESVAPERLYVNPSCGLEYLPREAAFEKLRVMVEGVRLCGEGVAA